MFKQSIYLVLILNVLAMSMVSADCTTQLANYFKGQNSLVQLTAVMKTGKVIYTRQTLYAYQMGPTVSMLTNGDAFNALSSEDSTCVGGKTQPFSKQITSFYDARGFILYPNGNALISPLWKVANDTPYSFQFICNDDSQVFYGFSQGNYFAISFVNGTKVGSSC